MTARITSIVYTPKSIGKRSTDIYDRVAAERVELVAGHGIQGDKKAGGNPQRHLNIMSRETLDQLAREGFKTAPGEMGEQITVSGIDMNSLKPGDRIQLGDSAVVEVSKPRTGCAKFKAVQGFEPSAAVNRLGMMATVIEGGSIAQGDPVRVVADTPVS